MLPVQPDRACPRDTVYLLPPDVKQAIDAADQAQRDLLKGKISTYRFQEIYRAALTAIDKAGKEKRIGIITNLK